MPFLDNSDTKTLQSKASTTKNYIGILICISTLRNNVRNKDNKKLRN